MLRIEVGALRFGYVAVNINDFDEITCAAWGLTRESAVDRCVRKLIRSTDG